MTSQSFERGDRADELFTNDPEKQKKQIVLFHLKKTSGTSVYRHLREATKADLSASWHLRFEDAKRYAILGGHYTFDEISSLDAIRICFLRDPISRVISHYNYVQTLSDHDMVRNEDAGATAMRALTLDECLDSADPDVLYDISNYYCKSFFGSDYDRSRVFNDDGTLTSFALATVRHIDFFGFSENFSASIRKLMSFLGLSQPKKMHHEKNINQLRENAEDASASIDQSPLIRKIASLNSDDILLHKAISMQNDSAPLAPPNVALGNFPVIEPGSSFQIVGRITSFANMLYSGWHDSEEGVWSSGDKATIALKNTGDVNIIILDLEIPIHSNLLSKTVSIKINQIAQYNFRAIKSNSSVKVAGLAPGDQFVSIPPTGRIMLNIRVADIKEEILFLKISVDGVFIPSMYADTGDDRELGFKLHRVTAY